LPTVTRLLQDYGRKLQCGVVVRLYREAGGELLSWISRGEEASGRITSRRIALKMEANLLHIGKNTQSHDVEDRDRNNHCVITWDILLLSLAPPCLSAFTKFTDSHPQTNASSDASVIMYVSKYLRRRTDGGAEKLQC